MSVQPPPLQVTETVIWKTVDGTDLKGDKYFLPRLEQNLKGAWFLYLHGGSWVSGRRDDYCRPLFQGILDRGGSVISLEYRLMPEATLLQVLQDIRDMESYMRKLTKGPVVIIGCSAGSYYAQYAASYWYEQPFAAILSSPITKLTYTPYTAGLRHLLVSMNLPMTEILDRAIDFSSPAPARFDSSSPYFEERNEMGRNVLKEGPAEFLLKGIQVNENGERSFFPKGCVSLEEIIAISPFHWAKSRKFPPTLILAGDRDDIFDMSHSIDLFDLLQEQKIDSWLMIVPGGDHACEMRFHCGDYMDRVIIQPGLDRLFNLLK